MVEWEVVFLAVGMCSMCASLCGVLLLCVVVGLFRKK